MTRPVFPLNASTSWLAKSSGSLLAATRTIAKYASTQSLNLILDELPDYIDCQPLRAWREQLASSIRIAAHGVGGRTEGWILSAAEPAQSPSKPAVPLASFHVLYVLTAQ